MDDMSGMMELGMGSMSSSGMFQTVNMALAQTYWYLIAGVMGMLLIVRALNYGQNWLRYLHCRHGAARQTDLEMQITNLADEFGAISHKAY